MPRTHGSTQSARLQVLSKLKGLNAKAKGLDRDGSGRLRKQIEEDLDKLQRRYPFIMEIMRPKPKQERAKPTKEARKPKKVRSHLDRRSKHAAKKTPTASKSDVRALLEHPSKSDVRALLEHQLKRAKSGKPIESPVKACERCHEFIRHGQDVITCNGDTVRGECCPFVQHSTCADSVENLKELSDKAGHELAFFCDSCTRLWPRVY
jgi:hypothetical protein